MKEIPLTQGKVAIVDNSDFEELSKFKWCAIRRRYTFYAVRNAFIDGKWRSIMMHRIITNASDGELIDHKDRNGLNNSRENLRIATRSQNAMNAKLPKHSTSGFKGAHRAKGRKNWVAHLKLGQKIIHLGTFRTAEEAHVAYCEAASNRVGEFFRAK